MTDVTNECLAKITEASQQKPSGLSTMDLVQIALGRPVSLTQLTIPAINRASRAARAAGLERRRVRDEDGTIGWRWHRQGQSC